VISFSGFATCGSEHVAKERGLLRSEGKDYVVQDGDIIHFRFNV
jgi:ribosome-binding ATPase